MFSAPRHIAIATSLLLSLVAVQASAADRPRIDKSSCSTPDYPVAWQSQDQQGAVKLALLVGADGSVQDAKVVESSGYSTLDKASLKAGVKCKFTPATKDGANTAEWTKVQYSWVIN
jgi:protein TonB